MKGKSKWWLVGGVALLVGWMGYQTIQSGQARKRMVLEGGNTTFGKIVCIRNPEYLRSRLNRMCVDYVVDGVLYHGGHRGPIWESIPADSIVKVAYLADNPLETVIGFGVSSDEDLKPFFRIDPRSFDQQRGNCECPD